MDGVARHIAWIAVDWGTTNMRAWAMGEDGAVLAETRCAQGMGKLAPAEFEPALLAQIAPWLGDGVTEVVACGMVGARQGWVEAPYREVPTHATGAPVTAPVSDPRLSVRVLPGVRQKAHPDVMRGEETQIAGFLTEQPDFDGVLCLPGTHTKWVRISAEEIVSFQTFMSGEMFQILTKHSVLRHSYDADAPNDADAYLEALSETLARPEALAAKLFQVRADGLVNGQNPARAKARLSGLLIGAELAGARPYWLGQDVVLIGDQALSARYRAALKEQGLDARQVDGNDMTRKGLTHAYTRTLP